MASAPEIASWVTRLRPSAAQRAPVATTTSSAPYSRTSCGPRAQARQNLDVAQLRRAGSDASSSTRAHSPRPGQAAAPSAGARRSPGSASTRWTRRKPRLPSTIAHSMPAGPGADDEHVPVAVRRRLEALRMPAPPVLLARGRVLRAADVAAGIRLRNADVAADALADLVVAAVLDLGGQERVGDRRPRGADHVPDAARDDLRHLVGIREPADADDRLRRRLPRPRRSTGSCQPAGNRLEAPESFDHSSRRADVDVPEIDEVVGEPYELETLVELDAVGAERLDAQPRAAIAQSSPTASRTSLERLEPEAGAVRERAAVLVAALVVVGRQELHRQVAVGAVHVDDVEAGRARPPRGRRPVALHAADVRPSPWPSERRGGSRWRAARGDRGRQAVLAAGRVGARVVELAARQSAPCSCARSHVRASARRSSSSQSRAEMKGVSSESGLIAQYSVQTAAQPPSAFMAREVRLMERLLACRSRSSAAPGRSGCAASSARSGAARRGNRGADRGPSLRARRSGCRARRAPP